jgi:RNA polymerase sigma factor (sigma-70 family)
MSPIDPASLGRWFDAYGAALVLYARQWLQAGAAEEAVQDAFVHLMGQRKAPRCVKAWLFAAVRNGAISRLRQQRRQKRQAEQLTAQRPEWFQTRPDDLIDAAAARQALAGLPQEQREVIVLRIWAGLTLQEISDITKQPVSTLFSRYRAGLAELRRRMESPCRTKNL